MNVIISVLDSLWFTFANIFNDKKYRNKFINKFWNQKSLGFLESKWISRPQKYNFKEL